MRIENTHFFSSGKKISARLRYPERRNGYSPAIILNHGYSGDKEEYDDMAEYLCANGFATLQFDSRGCGESEAARGRMMCSTEWYEDAHNAVSFLQTNVGVDRERIGYTGCSMGGAVTLYMASQDPRIKCAVAMAPYAYGTTVKANWALNVDTAAYEAFLSEIAEDCRNIVLGRPSKFVPVPYALGMNAKDTMEFREFRDQNPQMVRDVPLESVYFGLIRNDPYIYAGEIKIPLMVIHGDEDTIIPLSSSYKLMELVHSKKELIVIPNGIHPLPTSAYKETVFEYALRWFCENL